MRNCMPVLTCRRCKLVGNCSDGTRDEQEDHESDSRSDQCDLQAQNDRHAPAVASRLGADLGV